MYDIPRGLSLDRCDWKADGDTTLSLLCVEAWRYEGDVRADDSNFAKGTLSSEKALQDWLARTNAGKGPQPRADKATGSVRLLVCDRQQYTPLDFGLSRQTFELIEREFGLHPLTVCSFESEAGTYSRFLVRSAADGSRLERIQTMLKAPQKREIFNWGLSLSYDVGTGATTGLLYGTGLGRHEDSSKHDRHKQCRRSPFEMLICSLQGAIASWDHPMLIACLFLSEHLSCINAFSTKGKVLDETVQIEHKLGVTKVGQSAYLKSGKKSQNDEDGNGHHVQRMGDSQQAIGEPRRTLDREEMEALTIRINTQSTRVAFTARSPEWNLACAHFILKTLAEIEPHLEACHRKGQHECKQLLEYNITLAEAAASNIAVLKERMALQLNVLYQMVAQLDNQTSAELAASASRDSTSMKILAFISALFLPGSFISAMFSMDMFDWRADGNAVLSSNFWVFWVTAAPLTVVTVLGWAAWWYFEMGRFDRKIRSIREASAARSAARQGP